jgi:hypothetical protein
MAWIFQNRADAWCLPDFQPDDYVVNGSVPHNRIFSFSSRFARQAGHETRRTPFNRLAIQFKVMVISCRHRPASATSSSDRPARSVHQQIRLRRRSKVLILTLKAPSSPG